MDEEDLPIAWIIAIIALPSLALIALQLLTARLLMAFGLAVLRCGHAIVRLAWYLNDR